MPFENIQESFKCKVWYQILQVADKDKPKVVLSSPLFNRVLAKLIFRFRVKHGMTKACHSQLDWES